MDLSDQSFDRFVELIYETLEAPKTWRTLYEELAEAIGAKSVHVLGLDKRHGTLSYSDGANLPVQGELAYMQRYRFIDPRMPLVMAKPVLGWIHCHEELDEEFVAQSEFYQDFLLPTDHRYLTACKLVDNSDATIIFAAMCGSEQGPLSSQSVAFLDRLLSHLSRACRIGVQNFIYSTQALVGHTLVNKLRQPVVLMTTGGELIQSNEAARRLLDSTHLVKVEDGKLKLPQQHHHNFLRRCAELESEVKTGDGPPGAPGEKFHSLQLMSDAQVGVAQETLYAFFTLLTPQGAMGTFGLRPMVMLFFYHPNSAPAIDSNLLFAAFGLTPAECRVASLLAEGLSLKQIADAQRTQHETVRKQLAAIYRKTATNRQPELIRLLLHLPHNAIDD